MSKDLDRKVFINVPNFYVRDEFFDENSNAEIDILIAKSIEILNKKRLRNKVLLFWSFEERQRNLCVYNI